MSIDPRYREAIAYVRNYPANEQLAKAKWWWDARGYDATAHELAKETVRLINQEEFSNETGTES